jgi:isoleucyl-tRNA synthetase
MQLVRRLVELGRAARATSGVKTRQPLRRALVSAAGWSTLSDDLRLEIAEELNVITLEALDDESAQLVDVSAKANFRSLGQRFAKQTPLVADAIASADAAKLAHSLRETGTATVTAVDLGEVALGPEDVIISETPREGWAVESAGGESIALDLAIDDALRRAGIARDIVRAIQEARKVSGLDVSDRIDVWWASDDEDLVRTMLDHGGEISQEVLAITYEQGVSTRDAFPVPTELPVTIALAIHA